MYRYPFIKVELIIIIKKTKNTCMIIRYMYEGS